MKSLLSPAEVALQQLGEHLLITRKCRRWTQAEVQARTGLSRVTIRRIEQGYPGVTMGNSDDHLRNHGLLKNISDHHYPLTPASDVVP